MIAIHHHSNSFSERWIEYCDLNKIPYKLVNCYSSNIIAELDECDGLMWHWSHSDPKAVLFAKQLTFSLESAGKKVFPNINTSWHFDDKVGQKYLLEAIDAPIVPSYVFYSKDDAKKWLNQTTFPKVFKLRKGASSLNVRLIRSKREALKVINQAFRGGFKQFNQFEYFKECLRKYRLGQLAILGLIKGFVRLFWSTKFSKIIGPEKGYIYFQEYLPDNDYDTRIIVIGDKAFAVRRYNRKNDFRASGSGIKEYEKELFDLNMVKIAFNVCSKISSQCLAFDFIYTADKLPRIIEISYGFITGPFYDDCLGYWDKNLNWHSSKFKAQYFMIEDFIQNLKYCSKDE